MRTLFILLAALIIGVGGPGIVQGHEVILQWTVSDETGIAGYQVYLSEESGAYGETKRYGNLVPVTNNPNRATVTGLLISRDYYFVVRSVNADGIESDYSNEVTKRFDKPEAPVLIIMSE